MSEQLFRNDVTRWKVFAELAGKVGTRWYLWLTCYLNACADAGGQAPSELAAFLPWSMEAARRAELCRALALAPVHQPPAGINSS